MRSTRNGRFVFEMSSSAVAFVSRRRHQYSPGCAVRAGLPYMPSMRSFPSAPSLQYIVQTCSGKRLHDLSSMLPLAGKPSSCIFFPLIFFHMFVCVFKIGISLDPPPSPFPRMRTSYMKKTPFSERICDQTSLGSIDRSTDQLPSDTFCPLLLLPPPANPSLFHKLPRH